MNEPFLAALRLLLIEHRMARTNTPPEVLAKHMTASLDQFEESLIERSTHEFYAPGRRYDEKPS